MSQFKVNSIIKGRVTGIEKYGIFINIDAYYNGLIHISEITPGFVQDIKEFVQIGETIYCKVLEVDEDSQHLKLSIKDVDYKIKRKRPLPVESKNGFKPLKDNLNVWINEKIREYNK